MRCTPTLFLPAKTTKFNNAMQSNISQIVCLFPQINLGVYTGDDDNDNIAQEEVPFCGRLMCWSPQSPSASFLTSDTDSDIVMAETPNRVPTCWLLCWPNANQSDSDQSVTITRWVLCNASSVPNRVPQELVYCYERWLILGWDIFLIAFIGFLVCQIHISQSVCSSFLSLASNTWMLFRVNFIFSVIHVCIIWFSYFMFVGLRRAETRVSSLERK